MRLVLVVFVVVRGGILFLVGVARIAFFVVFVFVGLFCFLSNCFKAVVFGEVCDAEAATCSD